MTCTQARFILGSLTYDYDEYGQFDDYCVDLERGDPKPQIRIANKYTLFNITNYALFENLEFTGEDLFASYTDHMSTGFNYPQGVLGFIPSTKCTVIEDPLYILDEIRFTQGESTIKG